MMNETVTSVRVRGSQLGVRLVNRQVELGGEIEHAEAGGGIGVEEYNVIATNVGGGSSLVQLLVLLAMSQICRSASSVHL
jgi:hypothetical protein